MESPYSLNLPRGNTRQPMFSKIIHVSHLEEAIAKAFGYSSRLNEQGFRITRIKMEVPSAYAERCQAYPGTAGDNYFEWHGKIVLDRMEQLLEVCAAHHAHLSRNSLKDEPTIRFITLREYGAKALFQQRVDTLAMALQQGDWPILKQQSEYCLYDTNTSLDKGWLPNSIV
jgi:hypothetical protein